MKIFTQKKIRHRGRDSLTLDFRIHWYTCWSCGCKTSQTINRPPQFNSWYEVSVLISCVWFVPCRSFLWFVQMDGYLSFGVRSYNSVITVFLSVKNQNDKYLQDTLKNKAGRRRKRKISKMLKTNERCFYRPQNNCQDTHK